MTDVIVLEGTNDLGVAPGATADQVIAGLRRIVKRLHRSGLRAIVGTQTPSKGYPGAEHGSPRAIAARNAVNRWVRTSGLPDGVVDFHAARRDPADRDSLRPAYDSGDHLHPNDAGYRAMARAVRLKVLRGPACRRSGR